VAHWGGTLLVGSGPSADPFRSTAITNILDVRRHVLKGPKREVAIQMGIEPPPSRGKGRIKHLDIYSWQIDDRQCLNLSGGEP
jgi:hypothetical protein